MFIKLDQEVIDILCCPICKSKLNRKNDKFVCINCATQYPLKSIHVGDHDEWTYDFCIEHPSYCTPKTSRVWREKQKNYEEYEERVLVHDKLRNYLDEINSVKEIYTQEFNIQGSVLDVGGSLGALRHFLSNKESSLYVSVDPFLKTFENIQNRSNLIEAYPCLSEPCNFLVCRAEELPFIHNSFNWVHMRSVVDHFEDPFKAFKEAYRVLKPGGNLMIGLTIEERIERIECPSISILKRIKLKIERDGIVGLLKKILLIIVNLRKETDKEYDHHNFHFTYSQLNDLFSVTRFRVSKEHWQKPPFSYCIYMTASPLKKIRRESV